MEALLCANTAAAGLPLPRHRTSPYTFALSVPVSAALSLGQRGLPARGLRCAGADWPELSFVGVAEKPDAAAARNARAAAGASGEEETGRLGAIDGVGGGAVEEPVAVPFAPFKQSLVAVDSVGDEAFTQAMASKKADLLFSRLTHTAAYHLQKEFNTLDFEETSTYVIYGTGAFFAGWILSAVVSAIDSIPLLPKILEIVGLGYIIWFSTRYLLFKENRDELLVKVDDLKRRIIGYGDE